MDGPKTAKEILGQLDSWVTSFRNARTHVRSSVSMQQNRRNRAALSCGNDEWRCNALAAELDPVIARDSEECRRDAETLFLKLAILLGDEAPIDEQLLSDFADELELDREERRQMREVIDEWRAA